MDREGYPVVNPAYLVIRTGDGVYLRPGPWSGPAYTIHDEPTSDDERLFDLLDGEHTLSRVYRVFDGSDSVERILRELQRKNVVYVLDDESASPRPRIPIETQRESIPDATGTGIDIHLLSHGDIGSLVTEYVEQFGGEVTRTVIDVESDVPTDAIADADFVIYLSDSMAPPLPATVNRACLEHDTPWLNGHVDGFDAVVGPTVVPHESACYRCYLTRTEANDSAGRLDLYRRGASLSDSGATFIPLVHLVESYVCMELAHVFQFGQGFTVERIFTVSATDMATEINDVLKVPRCSACASLQERQRFVDFEDLGDWRERHE